MEKKLQLIQTIWDVMALLSALHFPSETTCSCKQDTKERYWGQQFWQVERDISVWVTEMTRPVTVDHLQSSGPEYSGQTKPKWSVPFMNLPKFPEFWLEWKAPVVYESATLILNPLSSRASGNCFMCYESGIMWMLKFIQTFFYPVTQQDWAQFFTVNTVFKMATLFQSSLSLTLRDQGKGVNLNLLLAFSFDFWADSTILLAIR